MDYFEGSLQRFLAQGQTCLVMDQFALGAVADAKSALETEMGIG
jgi:hypothetical protein